MKKYLLISLPLAVVICGFSIKTLLPKKETSLNHVALHVYDLQKSTSFYQHIIELDTVPEPFHDGKHTWMKVSSTSKLHLISGAEKETTHDKFVHLCFSVPSLNDFINKLDKEHIPYESWLGAKISVTTRVDGIKQIFFQDPDGYWIEVNDDTK
jgi:lactoylglutathione lyase